MSKKNKHKDQHAPAADHNTGQEESTNRHVYIEPGAKIDFVQDLRDKYDAAEQDSASHSNKILFWTKISAALLFIYAALTFWQELMTRKSITDASRHFQIDQRSYVWKLDFISPKDIHIVANERMWTNIHWVNYGKSPAVRTSATGKIFVGPTAMQDADQWFAALGNGPLIAQPGEEIIIAPGIPSDLDKPAGGYSTILTDDALKQDEIDHMQHTSYSVAMALRIQYYAMHGHRYWSDLCFSRYEVGSFPYCNRHNEMH